MGKLERNNPYKLEWFHPAYNWILGSDRGLPIFFSACQKSTMSAAQEITATPMLDGLWNGWKVGKVFRNPVNWSVEVGCWNANFYRWCMRFLASTAHSWQIGWARGDVCFMPWGSQFYSVRKTTFKRAFFSKAVISRFILFKRNIEIISSHSCSGFFWGMLEQPKFEVSGLPQKRWHAHTHRYIYIYVCIYIYIYMYICIYIYNVCAHTKLPWKTDFKKTPLEIPMSPC